MAIDIVDFPVNTMVIFQSYFDITRGQCSLDPLGASLQKIQKKPSAEWLGSPCRAVGRLCPPRTSAASGGKTVIDPRLWGEVLRKLESLGVFFSFLVETYYLYFVDLGLLIWEFISIWNESWHLLNVVWNMLLADDSSTVHVWVSHGTVPSRKPALTS